MVNNMQDLQLVINKLQELSIHELYRLSNWIQNEINQPQKIQEIRNNFKVGDRLLWFDDRHNAYIHGVVLAKKRTQVILQSDDLMTWKIPYYLLNLESINATLPINHKKLTKNDFKINEMVEFTHDRIIHNGNIIRLNHKTATIRVGTHVGLWRVSYNCLSKLIDGDARTIVGELV